MELGWLLAILVLFLSGGVWFSWRHILEHSLKDLNSASLTISTQVSSKGPSLAGVARLRTALSRWLPAEDPLMRDLAASHGRLALEVQAIVAQWQSLRRKLAFGFTTPGKLRAFYEQLRELSIKIGSVYNGDAQHRYHELTAVERYVVNARESLDEMACAITGWEAEGQTVQDMVTVLEGAFVVAAYMDQAYADSQWEEANDRARMVQELLQEITTIRSRMSQLLFDCYHLQDDIRRFSTNPVAEEVLPDALLQASQAIWEACDRLKASMQEAVSEAIRDGLRSEIAVLASSLIMLQKVEDYRRAISAHTKEDSHLSQTAELVCRQVAEGVTHVVNAVQLQTA